LSPHPELPRRDQQGSRSLAIGLVRSHDNGIADFEIRQLCGLTILPEFRAAGQLESDFISIGACHFNRIAPERGNFPEYRAPSALTIAARATLLAIGSL
jgi:hypothetical protein